MASYNKVILMGNLTRDPELRYTGNNTAVCSFGLAVNRRYKDSQTGEWKEVPTFVDVTIFGSRAEPFSRYHSKGKPAFIEGSLRMDTWEDKTSGGKRSKLYVVADTWEFVGSGRGEQAGGYAAGAQGGSAGAPGPSGTGAGAWGSAGGGPEGGPAAREFEGSQADLDDTPF
jgi:single-strand DNA-binding protein